MKAYARQKDEPGDYNSVLEYRINATSGGGAGFPMAFEKFSEAGAYLYGPLEGKAVGRGELPVPDQSAGCQECVCGMRGGMDASRDARGGSVRRECDCKEGRCGGIREFRGKGVGWGGEVCERLKHDTQFT